MSNISIIIYIILSLSIGYTFAYPTFGDISKLLDQKQKYEVSLEKINNIENKKSELLTMFNNISTTTKKDIETILPDSLNFINLIAQIDAIGARYGLSIGDTSYVETDLSVGSSVSEAEPQKPFKSAIVSFAFDSSYEQFNSFMNDLEKSLRILDVRSLKIESGDKGIYSYSVEFETYWLKVL